jgi:hypothetical protein
LRSMSAPPCGTQRLQIDCHSLMIDWMSFLFLISAMAACHGRASAWALVPARTATVDLRDAARLQADAHADEARRTLLGPIRGCWDRSPRRGIAEVPALGAEALLDVRETFIGGDERGRREKD